MSVSHSAVTNTYSYDALRQPIFATDGRGNTRATLYNHLGQLTATADYFGDPRQPAIDHALLASLTTYAYDQAGRRVATTDPLGNTTHTAYDVQSRVVATWGATYPVAYEYDTFGRMSAMATTRSSDLNCNLRSLLPPGISLSHTSHASYPSHLDTTQWLYDAPTGLLTNKLYANGHGTTYTYTPEGKLASRIWARGITTSYSYDGHSQLTGIQYSDSTPDVSYTYDALGRVVSVMDASGTRSFSHTLENLPLSDMLTAGGLVFNLTEKYDTLGRSEGYVLSNLTAGAEIMITETIQSYAIEGRLGSVAVSGAGAFNYDRLPGSDLVQTLAMPNGVTRETLYEPHRNLPTIVSHTNATGTILTRRMYDYDAAGHLTNRSQFRLGDDADLTSAFTCNARSELIQAIIGVNAYAYAFDTIGNRLSATENAATASYLSSPLNQYTAIAVAPTTFDPQYDLDGNQTLIKTTTGIWHVTYNAENRPVCFSNQNATVIMGYDYQGRRFEYKEKVSGAITRHERYLYRGYLQLAALDLLATTNVIHTIVWDPTEPVATRPLVLQTPSGWFTYSFDQVKNVTEMFDSNGTIAATYDYAPFGAVTSATGFAVAVNPLTFSSEIADTILGLIYYNFRPYNPLDGRWINRDPIGSAGGENHYQFNRNNSIIGFDRLGLKPKKCKDDCELSYLNFEDTLYYYLSAVSPENNNSFNTKQLLDTVALLSTLPKGTSIGDLVAMLSPEDARITVARVLLNNAETKVNRRLHIVFRGTKCAAKTCCLFWKKNEVITCHGVYECERGPTAPQLNDEPRYPDGKINYDGQGRWGATHSLDNKLYKKIIENCKKDAKREFLKGKVTCE